MHLHLTLIAANLCFMVAITPSCSPTPTPTPNVNLALALALAPTVTLAQPSIWTLVLTLDLPKDAVATAKVGDNWDQHTKVLP